MYPLSLIAMIGDYPCASNLIARPLTSRKDKSEGLDLNLSPCPDSRLFVGCPAARDRGSGGHSTRHTITYAVRNQVVNSFGPCKIALGRRDNPSRARVKHLHRKVNIIPKWRKCPGHQRIHT